jgi:hypothetical protein
MVLIPLVIVLVVFCFMAKDAPDAPPPKTLAEYLKVLKDKDAWWFMFFYSVTFGGFVGLASSLVIYFNTQYGLDPKMAGFFTAGCVFAGSLVRPIGGNVADRIGGVKSLTVMYIFAAIFLAIVSFGLPEAWMALVVFVCAMLALGMGNGAVFQLVPQRFKKEIGVMTGLVGMAGGVGGFYLASSLGYSRQLTGSYQMGFLIFAALAVLRPGRPDRRQDPLAHHLGCQPPDLGQDLNLAFYGYAETTFSIVRCRGPSGFPGVGGGRYPRIRGGDQQGRAPAYADPAHGQGLCDAVSRRDAGPGRDAAGQLASSVRGAADRAEVVCPDGRDSDGLADAGYGVAPVSRSVDPAAYVGKCPAGTGRIRQYPACGTCPDRSLREAVRQRGRPPGQSFRAPAHVVAAYGQVLPVRTVGRRLLAT